MTVAEQPCYTLINASQDTEPLSEMQLREDLEKGNDKVSSCRSEFDRPGRLLFHFRPKLKH